MTDNIVGQAATTLSIHAIALGRSQEQAAIREYIKAAVDYYKAESDDESKPIDHRLESITKSKALLDVLIGIVADKHRETKP